jgi:hypothetical protein
MQTSGAVICRALQKLSTARRLCWPTAVPILPSEAPITAAGMWISVNSRSWGASRISARLSTRLIEVEDRLPMDSRPGSSWVPPALAGTAGQTGRGDH